MTYVEKLIARQCVADLLRAGYSISVNDSEETTLRYASKRAAILAAMDTTDEDLLLVHDGTGKQIGWIRFIYGNDGWDVINDYTTNLESVLTKTNALADKLSA